jgi:CRP/FNR family transcriptional regulator, cyclic AMP receptor protein
MTTVAATLAEQPLFAGMTSEHLSAIATCVLNHDWVDEGTILFQEGRVADRFYVLASGTVSLSLHTPHKGPLVIETVHGPDVVGWSWLFPPGEWHFDAVVTEEAEVVVVDGKRLHDMIRTDPELGLDLMTRFAGLIHRRLTAARLRLLDLYGRPSGDA